MAVQSKEEISLEYKVKFEDCFRPTVCVYGVNSDKKFIYSSAVIITPYIQIGGDVKEEGNSLDKGKQLVIVKTGYNWVIGHNTAIYDLTPIKIPETISIIKAERIIQDLLRTRGRNCIKVKRPDHIRPAIDRYIDFYLDQFVKLAEDYAAKFKDFYKANQNLMHNNPVNHDGFWI